MYKIHANTKIRASHQILLSPDKGKLTMEASDCGSECVGVSKCHILYCGMWTYRRRFYKFP